MLNSLNNSSLVKIGTDLIFPFLELTVKGIPGLDLQILYKGEDSPYTVETVKPQIRITSEILETLMNAAAAKGTTVEGLTFTLTDSKFTFTFQIDDIVPDLLGWMYLNCTLVSRGF
jgi:hypothetical protein